MRCSWQKGRGALTGFFDNTTGVFEDMNISKFPTHFPNTSLLPFAVQLHIYILDRILHLRNITASLFWQPAGLMVLWT